MAAVGVRGGIVTPACVANVMSIPSPMDGFVTLTCTGSDCRGCEFTCPAGVACTFVCTSCEDTVIKCADASSCAVTCTTSNSCKGLQLDGGTAGSLSLVCGDSDACKSGAEATCPNLSTSTCAVECQASTACDLSVVPTASTLTVTCSAADSCSDLTMNVDTTPSSPSTGDVTLKCVANAACKSLTGFQCPYSGVCNVECQNKDSCETMSSLRFGNGLLVVTCAAETACKSMTVSGQAWANGDVQIDCSAKSACESLDATCKDDCSLTCSADSACKDGRMYPGGGTTTVACSGGSTGCDDLRVERTGTYTQGTVEMSCSNADSCDNMRLKCPEEGTCNIACNDDKACNNLDLNCDRAKTTCTVNCPVDGACSNLDYNCRPDNRQATCKILCMASGACDTTQIDGDLTGSICVPPPDQTSMSACRYSGMPDQNDIAFYALQTYVSLVLFTDASTPSRAAGHSAPHTPAELGIKRVPRRQRFRAQVRATTRHAVTQRCYAARTLAVPDSKISR